MKISFVATAILATIPVACSGPDSGSGNVDAVETADNGEMMPGTGTPMTDFAEVTDGMQRPVFVDPNGPANVAVSGYDPVSYFESEGIPAKGKKDFGVTYNGFDYYFTSADNAEKFEADPTKYAPQFGGHCAWAMSRGRLAPGDPQVYKIVDGKLYLNFSKMVQTTWEKDIPGFLEKANAAWPEVPADATFDKQ